MGPLLSAYCDGEASAEDSAAVREHLRACAGCRAAMRAYRSTPAAVAALAPALPASRSLLGRAHDLLASLHSRLPGPSAPADSPLAQVVAAGGTRGAGMAALAKALAICAGTVGGAAACVATGVAPAPLGLAPDASQAPKVERVARRALEQAPPPAVEYQPAPEPAPQPSPKPEHAKQPAPEPVSEAVPAATEASAGAVEYSPPPPSAPAEGPAGASSGSAAGEFGP